MTTYLRFVALGDNSTEGLDDPDELGGSRGWAHRFAARVAQTSPDLAYAKLAEALGLTGADGQWRTALPGRQTPTAPQRSRESCRTSTAERA